MALLEIVTYPNPVLETPGEPVTVFDEELRKLVADMFETMDAASGVGLAAPQVGVSRRLFVMDCSGGRDPKQRVALVNPVVLNVEGEQNGDEGCLSFPGVFFPVKRSLRILRLTISRLRTVVWSMKTMPSQWSVSCNMQRAVKSMPSSSNVAPVTSCAPTTARQLRL
jgi:peptide deformylase